MRTHLLSDLSISGREKALQVQPKFDFYNLNEICRLVFESHKDDIGAERSADLFLTAIYKDTMASSTYEVTLKFTGMRYAKLPELSPSFFLSEIEIEDIKVDQLEGVEYRTKNYGTVEFEVLSKDIEVIECRQI